MNDLLRTPEVAALLGLHPSSVKRMAKAGKISFYKIGGAIRFRRDLLERELDEKCLVLRKKT